MHSRSYLLAGLLSAVALTAALPAWAGSDAGAGHGRTSLSDADQDFIDKAVQSSLAQDAFGSLAAEKGRSAAVKAFGKQAVEEAHHLRDALSRLAQAKNFAPPTVLDKEDRDFRDNLATVAGPDFDRVYARHAIGDELKTIHLYQGEAMRKGDADIEGFVAETLPRLQRQYDGAREAEAALPGTAPLMSPSGIVEARRPTPGPVEGTEGE